MNNRNLILILVACLCIGCGTQKRVTTTTSHWHSLRISNAEATIQIDESILQVSCNIQAVKDSFIAISFLPIRGLEALRIELTPKHIMVMDKVNHRYAQAVWKEASTMVAPRLRWVDIQTFVEGQCLTQSMYHSLGYNVQGHSVSISLENEATMWDEPLRVRPINLSRYQQVPLLELLQL